MKHRTIPLKYERKTFSSHAHIIHTKLYKIYRIPMDVYTYDNKYVGHLEEDQFVMMMSIRKYPQRRYNEKADEYINKILNIQI